MPHIHRAHSVLTSIAALFLAAPLLLILPGRAEAQGGSPCVECHTRVTPGIVDQWQKGKMGARLVFYHG
jgi:hypothetical protein